MTHIYLFQFFIFSICVNFFSIFTWLIYYSGLLTSNLFQDIKSEYDYIIVGSGTAGSLIAHRLAETNYTYIVIEAGGFGHHFHDIPAFGPLLLGSHFDWGFETVPQDNACLAMDGH
ncbi:glucose dehydrogenase, partial [Danaus plexippus plexippus]